MHYTNQISNGSGNYKHPALVTISEDVKLLIEHYKQGLRKRLSSEQFVKKYSNIEDILIKKYHLANIDEMEAPDYYNKTEFMGDGVRGNFQKASGNILSYKRANKIISRVINAKLP